MNETKTTELTLVTRLATAYLGPMLITLCMALSMLFFDPVETTSMLALLFFSSYVGSLFAKALFEELYPQSALVMAAGFHINAVLALAAFYMGNRSSRTSHLRFWPPSLWGPSL